MKIWTGNNRARNHDYASKCKYHITMLKAEGVSNFGMLTGDYRIPVGNPGSSYIAASPIGKAIKAALRQIPDLHHALKLYQYALMPDHLHIIIAAEERLDEALEENWQDLNDKHPSLPVKTASFHRASMTKSYIPQDTSIRFSNT